MESGKRVDRPQLAAALAACRTRRSVLLIAKLNRLARNARFLLSVVEGIGEAGMVSRRPSHTLSASQKIRMSQQLRSAVLVDSQAPEGEAARPG